METDSNGIRTPFLKFRGIARFQHKYAVGCALREKMQISQSARFAQNYAVRVSDFVRKLCSRVGHRS